LKNGLSIGQAILLIRNQAENRSLAASKGYTLLISFTK
jgi:hypothetical protein